MTETETDLLHGLPAIARHLGMKYRQAAYLHEQGELPTFKIGKIVCARRSTLAKHFAAQERAAQAGKGGEA